MIGDVKRMRISRLIRLVITLTFFALAVLFPVIEIRRVRGGHQNCPDADRDVRMRNTCARVTAVDTRTPGHVARCNAYSHSQAGVGRERGDWQTSNDWSRSVNSPKPCQWER